MSAQPNLAADLPASAGAPKPANVATPDVHPPANAQPAAPSGAMPAASTTVAPPTPTPAPATAEKPAQGSTTAPDPAAATLNATTPAVVTNTAAPSATMNMAPTAPTMNAAPTAGTMSAATTAAALNLNTTATAVASANTSTRVVQGTGYMQAYQQARMSQNAAIAANQAAANARAGMTLNGAQPVMRAQALQNYARSAQPVVNSAVGSYQRMMGIATQQAQKRAYAAAPTHYAQNNARTVSAVAAAAASVTPAKYMRTPNGRAPTNNYKNHLHAQDAATRYKAAYNNAGPALVSIVENAAAYFEGNDTQEALHDKERSYERYMFNADLLAEIFEGPLPQDGEQNADADPNADAEGASAEPLTKHKALEKVMRMNLLQDIGGKMMTRSHAERMEELDALKERYARMEDDHRKSEKGAMKLFQKVDRATTIDELRRVRAEYEKTYGVQFVEHPPLFEKRELDHTLPLISPAGETTIVKL